MSRDVLAGSVDDVHYRLALRVAEPNRPARGRALMAAWVLLCVAFVIIAGREFAGRRRAERALQAELDRRLKPVDLFDVEMFEPWP